MTSPTDTTVEIGGQIMTQAQFDAARFPLLNPAGPTDTDPLDLDAIKARADAATPGPWSNEPDTGAGRVWVQLSPNRHGGRGDLEPVFAGDQGRKRRGFWVRSKPNGESMWGPTREEQYAQMASDAEFIAAARSDIPALLGEVSRLRDQLAATERWHDASEQAANAFFRDKMALFNRVTELEGVVARITANILAIHYLDEPSGDCMRCGWESGWPCSTARAVLGESPNQPTEEKNDA